MNFFESLLVLLLVAIALLQVSRRLSVPYPSMLAMAGVAAAVVPGVPYIALEPETALALFIAPALMDAAFDFPVNTARRYWVALIVFAVGGVAATAVAVAVVGSLYAGLPVAAALVLGAIVAPPDAAAATAVLSGMSIPRSTDAVLRGESLFNDAAALLIFGAALSVQTSGGLGPAVALHFAIAAPGGILLGIATAWATARVTTYVAGTLGGNLLQFVQTFLLWILAERLGLSAVLAIVAFAMTAAASSTSRSSARMRVQSYAVWSAVVFVLNVMAFLLMGMQVRDILGGMTSDRLIHVSGFIAAVVATVVLVRFVICIGFNRLRNALLSVEEQTNVRQSVLAAWCGMRGLVTLATAFALPSDFPQRDLVVLAAFAVVLATLVLQGLTLAPLIRLLGLDQREQGARDMTDFRLEIASAGLERIEDRSGPEAELVRNKFAIERAALIDTRGGNTAGADALRTYRTLALEAIDAQRKALERLRTSNRLNVDEYNLLLEEIDWRELAVLPDDERRIEET
ncbi:sodium:proton antiporter [Rhizobium sp. Leaf384]|uniref:cation:proton antiporter n=1 Tax=unclassified Rhizobium TaxID=2613769 RepID=UPI000712EE15|nr:MULTISPECIES: cation:proton antiporter [unclassified Rhizobium]KQS77131.1 sodium:proton antiporter [Rhizobium sp. Leaf384]KQS78402.1 sodium:proton antiporter [Rhizobium sp. Leaf383]